MRTDRREMLRGRTGALAAVIALLAGLACVDEKIVYRERAQFDDPPSTAANFVGYNRPESRQTVCGACHVGAQTMWATTGHANAHRTLDTLPAARKQDFCYACHTVSPNGNSTTSATGGWTATRDARYRDVQCESCHGPGLQHVTNPTTANVPLASIRADTNLRNGCAGCHSGIHHPFVAEWRASRHGTPAAWGTAASSPNNNPSCQGCHTGQGKLNAMGVDARSSYAEEGFRGGPVALTCAVCHDPHSGANRGQLRMPIDVPDEQRNLCMSCHTRRGAPEIGVVGARNSPHAPEGPLLLGTAGWWPPGLTVPGGLDRIQGTHGTEKNPRLCAGCHVTSYTVRDSLTGQTIPVTGHRFLPIPCVDAQGVPTRAQNCTSLTQRSFRSCATSGCHGSEAAARSAYAVAEQRLTELASQITTMLARVPASEISSTDTRYTTAEGAQFNAALARTAGSAAHNPFLVEALLTGSIQQLRRDYNLTVSATLDLRNTMLKGARAHTPAAAVGVPTR
ncbi:MAG: cytochrome c3 family protein [Gemmatirosa sp.]